MMQHVSLQSETDWVGWRNAVRHLLHARVPPDQVQWGVGDAPFLFDQAPVAECNESLLLSRSLIEACEAALLHRDPQRFARIYRLLYRVTADPRVWRFSLDEDVSYLRALCKSVRRDVHKMKAFVRFREVRA
ncbi:MAG TPA: DUF4130 domain-containing protein, partial [Burkholderiales bacterium]|nr:DUF4130 domain-containing protein [Burkholderiales bacterium]